MPASVSIAAKSVAGANLSSASGRHQGLERARVVAMLAVLVIHIASPPNQAYGHVGIATFLMSTAFEAASRFAVPLFVMISGALLLDERTAAMSFHAFYRRRASKLLVPATVWVAFYEIYRLRSGPPFGSVKAEIGTFIDGHVYYHLYYLWVIIGLYVITPLLVRAIAGMTSSGLLWLGCALVGLGVTTSFVPDFIPSAGAQGTIYWISFVGYFVLGRALFGCTVSRPARIGWIGGYLLATVACTLGTYVWVKQVGLQHGQALYDYLSPTTIVATVAMFMLIVNAGSVAQAVPTWYSRAIRFLSDRSLGVYLIHPLFLTELQIRGSHPGQTGPAQLTWIVQTYIEVFAMALAASTLLSRIPYLRRAV